MHKVKIAIIVFVEKNSFHNSFFYSPFRHSSYLLTYSLLLFLLLFFPSFVLVFYIFTGPFVKMVQRVLILMVVMHVFVLMVGLEMIAVKILMIVLMLLALMVQHALMELEILRADAHQERLDYYVIWMMLVHLILVIRMPYVKRVQSMVPLHVHVLKDSQVLIVQRILMNVILDHHVNIMVFASIHQDHFVVTAHKDLLVRDVRQTSMNVSHIRVRMKEAVWTILGHLDVFVCQVRFNFSCF